MQTDAQRCWWEMRRSRVDLNALIRRRASTRARRAMVRNSLQSVRAIFAGPLRRLHGVRGRRGEYQSRRSFSTLFDLGREAARPWQGDNRSGFGCVGTTTPQWRRRIIGVHQYLVAKEVVDADVHHQSSKLKTHKKAGVTCARQEPEIGITAIRNISASQSGGPKTGGDNYPTTVL